jgi:hypothetical protein
LAQQSLSVISRYPVPAGLTAAEMLTLAAEYGRPIVREHGNAASH